MTIVYISHRLEEVFELCDRVSVLRDGALVGTRRIARTERSRTHRADDQPHDRADLSQGRRPDRRRPFSRPTSSPAPASATSRSRCAKARSSGFMASSAPDAANSFKACSAASPRPSGRIAWQGREVAIRSERQAMDLGIALAPESRRDQGLCLNLGVGLNINLPIFKRLEHRPADQRRTRSRSRRQADPRRPDQDRLARGAGRRAFRAATSRRS